MSLRGPLGRLQSCEQQPNPSPRKIFMSISPNDSQGSSPSSSSLNPSQTPTSGNGLLQLQDFSGSAAAHESRSARVAVPESDAGFAEENSGALAEDAKNCHSSKQIQQGSGLRITDANKGSKGHFHGSPSHCRLAVQSGLSSQFRSDQPHSGSGNITGHSASRKSQMMNANHLLNFQYDPISRPQPGLPPPRKPKKIKPYNKDLFLQANFKFVILDSSNHVEPKDPDKMLQWEDVVCVRYSSAVPVECPICLESPLCPQITSCGHIFCFPCILRYLLMGADDDKMDSWKKCPLCFMMISSKDLHTIYIDDVKRYCVGDQVQFTLLNRAKDSLTPAQKDKSGKDVISDSFSKFSLASDVDLSGEKAQMELTDWLTKADSGMVDDLEHLPHVCVALEQLEQRKKYWTERRAFTGSTPVKHKTHIKKASKNEYSFPFPGCSITNPEGFSSKALEPERERSFFSPGESSNSSDVLIFDSLVKSDSHGSVSDVPETNDASEKLSPPSGDEKNVEKLSTDRKEGKDSYTFYQAVDGQNLILHPLNMNCLLHHYGDPHLLPSRISGKILQLETLILSEAVRRRFRFLSHLSLTTTFQLCEIDMSDILPPDALAPFIDEIKKRHVQRKRLAKKESKEKARAEATTVPRPSNVKRSPNNDANFSIDDFEVLGNPMLSSTSPPIPGERKLFSDVTRLGFAAAHDSPSLRADRSSDTSRSTEKAVDAPGTTGGQSPRISSFANIISTAKSTSPPDPTLASGLGKKGKKHNRILLSTAGYRRY